MDKRQYRLLLAKAFSIGAHSSQKAFAQRIKTKLETKYAEKVRLQFPSTRVKFDAGTFCGYLKDFNNGTGPLYTGKGNYPTLLAIYIGFDDLEGFLKKPPEMEAGEVDRLLGEMAKFNHEDNAGKNDEERNTTSGVKWPSFVRMEQEFVDMELGLAGTYRIYCVTHSLYWAFKFISERVKEIESNENSYQYILTEKRGEAHKMEFDELLAAHPKLAKKICIRTLYNSDLIKDLAFSDVTFPLYNDIVIYTKYNDKQEKFSYHLCVLGITPEHLADDINFAIVIPEQRGSQLFTWFKSVWAKLDSIS